MRDSSEHIGEEVGEATGGITGVLFGAGIGSAAGPVGTLIGGVAGALGGWWAGRAVADAAGNIAHDDEEYFREHYDSQPNRAADRAYDDMRPAYYLGQIAAHNPNFTAREFREVEPELEKGWTAAGDHVGSWSTVRAYIGEGFSRGRSKLDDSTRRGSATRDGLLDGERNERRP